MITETLKENYAKEFIVLTRKLIQQYEDIVIPVLEAKKKDNECYDITLLINCFYGLLMMPSKMNWNTLKKYGSAKEVLEKNNFNKNQIITFKTNSTNDLSFEELVRSIRNGLSHWEENNPKYRNKNFENEPFGLDFEPKETGQLMDNIIIRGSINDYKTDVTTTFKITHGECQKRVLNFLSFIYKSAEIKGEL